MGISRKRTTRSPSPAGSASSTSSMEEPLVKKVSRKTMKSKPKNGKKETIAMAAILALQELAGFSKSGKKKKYDDEDEVNDDDDDEPQRQKPLLVNWSKYHVKDNGLTFWT
eukprot:GFUD01110364.1.p1 GENE.GFUD01110364.1~~GFUD01110364.1.p1  ORF type:complete len:111 (+),score=40.93 GFUD01110364.1:181-513(+)